MRNSWGGGFEYRSYLGTAGAPTLDGGDMSQFKVLVVDDAPLMRMTIVNILKGDPNLKVVGKAKNGVEALKMMMSTEPTSSCWISRCQDGRAYFPRHALQDEATVLSAV